MKSQSNLGLSLSSQSFPFPKDGTDLSVRAEGGLCVVLAVQRGVLLICRCRLHRPTHRMPFSSAASAAEMNMFSLLLSHQIFANPSLSSLSELLGISRPNDPPTVQSLGDIGKSRMVFPQLWGSEKFKGLSSYSSPPISSLMLASV